MSVSLVRCPFCGKRFNISGIPAGTRLRCSGCTAVLTVPQAGGAAPSRRPLTLSLILQVSGGIAAGLIAAGALYLVLRPLPPSAPPAAAPATPPPVATPPEESASTGREKVSIFWDTESKAKAQLSEEFGHVFMFYSRVRPYLLAVESSERYIGTQVIEDYGKRLETLHGAFRREIGDALKLPEVGDVLTVVVLNSRESFDRYCLDREKKVMSSQIKGIYEYNRQRIVVYYDVHAPYEVLFHEGIHQLVHYYSRRETGGARSMHLYWFQEGLGTYFEGFRRAGDAVVIDPRVNRGRLPVVKEALQDPVGRRSFIPLSVLVGMTVDEFWEWYEKGIESDTAEATRKAHLYYAESWAFVHFLRQMGGGYTKTFDEYFRAEVRGEGGKRKFEEILKANLGMELDALQEKFVEYVLGLK
jgi:hypothetical protein